MVSRLAKKSRRLLSRTRQALLLTGGLLLATSCGEQSNRPQISDELLLVYSGDFRGFFEPCG